ncbi:hypothetical protein HMPREF1143_2115 [Peptoanaerobacter stomatis]|jgi:hypothetical protein|uniref:Uncharacterized protein n=1 Tax=Peptoanaerobacter stomatis TaxID=796937 RepID=J6HM66_9FIRM|nr:hypothetical protein [Peptoanaerobacter stomatis]EJU23533.1 hypothetical protein HMPREF1143_2115 [Peptoanaerobacter stomatis]NWO24494.1 hypothetical protein [Peptostreptococcaceae bacterium oral taxon 081]
MSKFKYTETEQQFNNVLNHQSKGLSSIKRPDMASAETCISESEALLKELGISTENLPKVVNPTPKSVMVVPTWEELCNQAEQEVSSTTDLEFLFTDEELRMNQAALRALNADYNNIHKLDKIDITICAAAGILGTIIDILLIGIPQKTPEGLKGGPLSNYVRDWFNQRFPEEEMEKLANSKVSKVPYDAQDNRHTKEYVDGLSAYYHRLLSLGHDPFLGLIFGVYDILTGKMTTIDKTGKIVSQVMENYADRKESDIFVAIAKQIIHFKSDITTSMGLPAPLMGLFNLLQFGSIGEEEQTIAEIVQGMYYEGYDFIHFCSMSIPTMIIEVIIRLGYGIKRIKEGNSIKNSIPFSLNREKHPKLSTMLFIGHLAATAVNAGKVYFTKNPMAINYPQWVAFAKYSYKQLKWVLLEKPELRDAYIRGIIAEELNEVYGEIDKSFAKMSEEYIVVFN